MRTAEMLLVALASCLRSAAAGPVGDHRVDLTAVLNKTVCPVVDSIDEDPARRPQRIRMLRCGSRPLEHCRRLGVPAQECCHVRRAGAALACAEVQDWAQVQYPARGDHYQPYRVSVGCVCVIDQPPRAALLAPS